MSSAVLEKFKHASNDLITKHISEGNLQLFLNDNLKLALTVTEKCFSLGLFNLSGVYDYTSDLICDEEKGLEWSYQLFKHALEQSTAYV
jgi:predicted transcriptional regulator